MSQPPEPGRAALVVTEQRDAGRGLPYRAGICMGTTAWRLRIESPFKAIKIWQRTTPIKVWVNAILTGSLRACSPQDKCKLP